MKVSRGRLLPSSLLVLAAASTLRTLEAKAANQVTTTNSGLRIIDFQTGDGPTPNFGQLINFHYVVYLPSQDGTSLTPIDSSYQRTPYLTKHGNGFTAQGIEEALHTMRKGGRRRVILPPQLGFTANKGPLPPQKSAMDMLFNAVAERSPLVFDLELTDIFDDLLDRGDYNEMTWDEYVAKYNL